MAHANRLDQLSESRLKVLTRVDTSAMTIIRKTIYKATLAVVWWSSPSNIKSVWKQSSISGWNPGLVRLIIRQGFFSGLLKF